MFVYPETSIKNSIVPSLSLKSKNFFQKYPKQGSSACRNSVQDKRSKKKKKKRKICVISSNKDDSQIKRKKVISARTWTASCSTWLVIFVIKMIITSKQFLGLYILFLQNLLNPDHVTSHEKSILIEESLSMIFPENNLATEERSYQYKKKKKKKEEKKCLLWKGLYKFASWIRIK